MAQEKSDYEKYREAKEKGLVKDTVYIHNTIYAEQQTLPEENNYNNYEFGLGYPFFFSWYYNWYNPWYSPYYYGWNLGFGYPYYYGGGYGWHRPYYYHHNHYIHSYYANRPIERRSAYGLSTTRVVRNTPVYERPRMNVRPQYNNSRGTMYSRPSTDSRRSYSPLVNRSSNVQQSRQSNQSSYSNNRSSYSAPSYSGGRSYSSGGGSISHSSSGRR